MSEPRNRKRANLKLRNMVEDFLDHMRYVVGEEWTSFRTEELAQAKRRYDEFADELWTMMLEKDHPTHCPCELCILIRIAEDR